MSLKRKLGNKKVLIRRDLNNETAVMRIVYPGSFLSLHTSIRGNGVPGLFGCVPYLLSRYTWGGGA
jgi:hypothetical protein